MLKKTSSEIIKQAQYLAQVSNSNLLDFQQTINILNNAYSIVYNDIATHSDSVTKSIKVSGSVITLPDDILSIKYIKQDNGNVLRPKNITEDGDYRVIGNEIHFNSPMEHNIYYIPVPDTKTISMGLKTSDFSNSDYELQDDGTFVKDGTTYYYHNNEFVTELPNDYLNGTFDTSTYIYTDENGVETDMSLFLTYYGTPEYIRISDPYMFVKYTNGSYRLFSGFTSMEYNPFKSEGKKFKPEGTFIDFTHNEQTGYGVYFLGDTALNEYGFTDDTVIDFPSNVYFQYMAYLIADELSAVNGISNDAFEQSFQRVRALYYSTLNKDKRPKQINYTGRYR